LLLITHYWTFAVTAAFALSVNVQVFTLLPPLEQAPDQMASRPLVTLSVIDVPALNDAEAVVPTLTLMPAGLEVTRSPLRPVAVTVSVAAPVGGGGGVVLFTVTFTAPDAVWLLAASQARANNECDALLAVVVFHDAEYGDEVSLDSSTPSTKNSTRVTPTLSEALAAIVVVPLTDAPPVGLEIDTDGAVVSGGGAVLLTVTLTAADVV
jgi:hypothetical protein